MHAVELKGVHNTQGDLPRRRAQWIASTLVIRLRGRWCRSTGCEKVELELRECRHHPRVSDDRFMQRGVST
jgi:hypothetical protein